MSELDDLKNDAEKYAKDHPDQVKEGEQDVEKKLGVGQQDQAGSGSTGDSGSAQNDQAS